MFFSLFPQTALAIGVLTSSLGVGNRDISRVVAGWGVIEGVAEGVVWHVGGCPSSAACGVCLELQGT